MSSDTSDTRAESQGRYPIHMAMLEDVFRFRHTEAQDISRRFQSVNDVVRLLERALEEAELAEVAEEDREHLTDLFEDETNVISFSLAARGSVIRL